MLNMMIRIASNSFFPLHVETIYIIAGFCYHNAILLFISYCEWYPRYLHKESNMLCIEILVNKCLQYRYLKKESEKVRLSL